MIFLPNCDFAMNKINSWETYYDPFPVYYKMLDYPIIPIAAVIAYGVMIVVGKKMMQTREPWKWRKYLAYWNFSLSLFSWIGAFRMVPKLLVNLATLSLRDNVCADPIQTYGSGSTGLWTQLFILSKFPELFDTFFIIIHKKPLIFLHWYHHLTVLLYCWHAYSQRSSAGIFFITMNYSVHAIMYGYYWLMAIKMKPTWMNAKFITTAQLSQMVVGVLVTLSGLYYNATDNTCHIEKDNIIAGCVMYGSYLFLFAQFFVGRYMIKTKRVKTV